MNKKVGSGSFPIWLIIIVLMAVLLAVGTIMLFTRPSSPSTQTGLVFANGQYIGPPYKMDVVNGDIQLNGQVISPLPTLPSTPAPPPTASPQTASELVDVAVSKLGEMNIKSFQDITPNVRAQLVNLIKSYPAAATVADQGTSIKVTDTTGNADTLLLDLQPPPTTDQLVSAQSEQAKDK